MNIPEVIAHRGFSGKAPENTLAAFRMAAGLDIDGIEFDVQLTRDNRVVVIHDETLERTTNGKGFVKDHTYDQLKELDAGSWFSKEFEGERIPLLEEVLKFVRGYGFFINIELKTSIFEYQGIEKLVLDSIKGFGMEKRVIISSFNHYSLKRFRELDKKVKTAVLCGGILYEPLEYLRSIGACAIHTHLYNVNESLVSYSKQDNISLRCYTANDEQEMLRLIKLGVNGIFTDYPDLLRRLKSI